MHELQSLLLQKLPRLGDNISHDFIYSIRRCPQLEDWCNECPNMEMLINVLEMCVEKEISHADILEALGEDWAMTGDYQLLFFPRGHTSMVFGMDMGPQWIEKGITLPRDLSDLSLPDYEETRKQLIQLLTK